MKAKKVIAFGVTTIIIIEISISRFIRLLKGEQAIYFLARIGGLKDISLISLLNIAFVALISFFKKVRFQPGSGSGIDSHKGNCTIFLNSSRTTTG
jgi:hypothetical protein